MSSHIFRKTTSHRGFTLVELLVVISIIALLSATVLSAAAAARDRGRIGASIQFANSNYHAISDYSVGYWNFSDGPGAINAKDISGNGNDLVFGNGCTRSTDTPGTTPYSLIVNGSCDVYTTFSVPVSITPTHTVSVWFKMTAANFANAPVLVRGYLPNGQANQSCLINMYIDSVGRIGFGFWNNTVGNWSGTSPTGLFSDGDQKWHQATYSINNTVATLYLDGKSVYTATLSNALSASVISGGNTSTNLSAVAVGGCPTASLNCGSPFYFTGLIDDVAIYNRALAASEIQHQYAMGLMKHTLASAQR